ncbi:MAG: hypothetical protein EOO34_00430 [Cyanobacteriota bacterium]|nr:MAG: hypothetical protein EOO34_00430 [Cyanobacteriota bacterium]
MSGNKNYVFDYGANKSEANISNISTNLRFVRDVRDVSQGPKVLLSLLCNDKQRSGFVIPTDKS